MTYDEALLLGVDAWDKLTDKQKAIVRFGMIPAEVANEHGIAGRDAFRGFAVGLMKAADGKGGGMVV